jgi:alginate O-acetyltransferase complex protein AlgI
MHSGFFPFLLTQEQKNMLFNSFQFFLFFTTVFFCFYFARDNNRWVVLLVASIVFYSAVNSTYLILVIALVTLIGYFFGRWIDRSASEQHKKWVYWSGVLILLSLLIYLRYTPFLVTEFNALLKLLSLNTGLVVPPLLLSIGVSFYIFQVISYLTDIRLGIQVPEHHFGYFALYVSFFPKILQGPIERAEKLLPQLHTPYVFDYEKTRSGLLQFTWGLFKKIVIADRLALFVSEVFDHATLYSGISLILATFYFAIQIYCDFSGYTDMALGCARIFNIELTNNFNRPYFATSIAEFWRRWHISFSRWIFDYIFKPVQMFIRRMGVLGNMIALLITFLVCGIWHGPKWGYIVWGIIHGIYLALHVVYNPLQKKILNKLGLEKSIIIRGLQMSTTFSLVCFAWIFFRADTISDAFYIISHLLTGLGTYLSAFISSLPAIGQNRVILNPILLNQSPMDQIILLFGLLVLIVGEIPSSSNWIGIILKEKPLLRWCFYVMAAMCILFLGTSGKQPFMYFKF